MSTLNNYMAEHILEEDGFIPKNVTGKSLDINTEKAHYTVAEAMNTFQTACTRLLLPTLWHELAGAASARFKLSTPGNIEPGRLIETGDLIEINIPGPGNKLGDGSDWVNVEAIKSNWLPDPDECFGMRLRAAANPNSDIHDIAHFFNNDSTSTFIISRKGKIVTVTYHGRNEVPNTGTESMMDNIRNSLVAAGAAIGFSNLQWSALIKGLLER